MEQVCEQVLHAPGASEPRQIPKNTHGAEQLKIDKIQEVAWRVIHRGICAVQLHLVHAIRRTKQCCILDVLTEFLMLHVLWKRLLEFVLSNYSIS